jgi:hypothetical protein
MKTILPYALAAVSVALILSVMAFYTGNRAEFVSNLGLNLVAELSGLAIGLLVGFTIAKKLADEKLTEVAPSILAFIKQLRQADVLNGDAARAAVTCAVRLISEERIPEGRLPMHSEVPMQCGICQLDVQCTPPPERCIHCNLPARVWT